MNPPSTSSEAQTGHKSSKPLTNDDFRTLMMTPRTGSESSSSARSGLEPSSIKRHHRMDEGSSRDKDRSKKKFRPDKDRTATSKEEEERIKMELSKKYRDRAKERRDGQVKDFELDPDDLKLTNPTLHCEFEDNRVISEDERRQQQIEESKFLGGDIKHTHLVKGLDFALLQKVKTELKTKGIEEPPESEDDSEDEAVLEAMKSAHLIPNSKISNEEKCRTRLAQNIIDVINEKFPQKNNLFLPGRMSYIMPIDLDSWDTPITITRSIIDSTSVEDSTTNDIIINKLIQIVSSIRQGKSTKRKKARDTESI